jgi:hypothetical protein
LTSSGLFAAIPPVVQVSFHSFVRRLAPKVIAVLVVLPWTALGEITLTGQTGTKVTGEVLRVTASDAILQVHNQRASLKLAQLTDESRTELIEYAKKRGVYAPFPPLKITPVVATQQRRLGSSYLKEMEVQPRVTIAGTSRLDAIPAAEATMIIVTMDTRAKYTEKREVYKVHTAETLPVPAGTGEPRQFAFAPSSVTFDSWRDTTNVGGAVYKYYIFGVRDPESKAIIDFQTNNPGLAALCKSHPEKREEFLSLQKGADFPASIK